MNCRGPTTLTSTSAGAPAGAAYSVIRAWYRPRAAPVPPNGSLSGRPNLKRAVPGGPEPRAGRPAASVAAVLEVGARCSNRSKSAARAAASSGPSTPSKR